MKKLITYMSVALVAICVAVTIFSPNTYALEPTAEGELDGQPAGTYPVSISYTDEVTGETSTRIVYMTVLYPKTVVGDGEAIDAMDVLLDKNQVAQLSDADLIAKAQVHAWNLSDGSAVPITQVEVKQAGTELYEITFATANGTSSTVTFIESVGTTILSQDEVYIAPAGAITETTMAWIYLSILTFVFFPIIIMIVAFLWMMIQVKRTKNLLYSEYSKK